MIVKKETEKTTPEIAKPSKKEVEAELEKHKTGDAHKDKCIKLFTEAFIENLNTVELSKSIKLAEDIICSLENHNLINDQKILISKLLNLKDKANPALIESVYNKQITTERFVFMTADEMKSAEIKKIEEAAYQQGLFESQIAEHRAESTAFKCSKCGQRKCSYRQLQTRSADEPMTTFITCACGHRWKF